MTRDGGTSGSHRLLVVRLYTIAFMIVMLFVAYMSFTQPLPTKRPDAQHILHAQVPSARIGSPPTAKPVGEGKAFVYIQIPRFGKDWFWTALEGVSDDVLASGPGHYPGTALPGEEGNSSFAGHRAGHGDPFIEFDKLRVGDDIVISQSDAAWTYKVTAAPEIITTDSNWVTNEFAPGKWLTLTTCWPKYGHSKRMYIRAKLDNARVVP